MHLYVTFTNEPDESYVAYATWCRFMPKRGPTHGLINFNYGNLIYHDFENGRDFENLMETVIHEFTHVLGFSDEDIKNWVD